MIRNVNTYFIDLDGTLVDEAPNISKGNIDAINKLSLDNNVVISTGRAKSHLPKFFESFPNIKYGIASSGAEIVTRDMVLIKEVFIEEKFQQEILEFALKNGLTYRVDNTKEACYLEENDIINKISTRFEVKRTGKDSLKTKNIHKVSMWGRTREDIVDIILDLGKTYKNILSIVSSVEGWSIEVTRDSATKGVAAKYMMEEVFTNSQESIHFGDSMNDSTTKGFVTYLVAMEDGSQELIDMCDIKGPKHSDSGLKTFLSLHSKI